ncbi:MAG: hypothetical protein LBT40_11295 [Deltaproteobacteria bacterium]|nr:hypothetical protein [Deltaproteobacteria bacterium]
MDFEELAGEVLRMKGSVTGKISRNQDEELGRCNALAVLQFCELGSTWYQFT